MDMRRRFQTSGLVLLALAGFVVRVDTARAYSISSGSGGGVASGSAGGTSAGFGSFTAPFENFIHSINNVGSVNIPAPTQMNLSAPSGGSWFTTWFKNTFDQFDNWLYGIGGFHIAAFFTAILGIFSWVLGIVKGGVDWALGAIK